MAVPNKGRLHDRTVDLLMKSGLDLGEDWGRKLYVTAKNQDIEIVFVRAQDIPEFKFREKVKGGLTGYAQVYGKYNTSALDKLKLDLTYIADYSVLLDFQIIFETIKILFQKESTEGFDSERAKEMHDADCK